MPYTTLIFDLDDTLYASSSGLWGVIRARMGQYMVDVLGLPEDEVPALRRSYFETYGTTLRALQIHHHVNGDDYLDYVHDLPLEQYIRPNPALRALLLSLPHEAKASVPTCSPAEAAERLAADPNLVLVDLREPPEQAQAKLARAALVPRGVLEFQIEKIAPDRRQPILLHCASGGRAALAVKSLAAMGYSNATAVIGASDELKRAVEGS